jgi:hypothetical protein
MAGHGWLAVEGREGEGEGDRGAWLGSRLGVGVPWGQLLGELGPLLGCSVRYVSAATLGRRKEKREKRKEEGKGKKKRKERRENFPNMEISKKKNKR